MGQLAFNVVVERICECAQNAWDAAYSAAHMLSMSGRGIAKVRLDLVRAPERTSDMAMLISSR